MAGTAPSQQFRQPTLETVEQWVHYCVKCSNCKSVYKEFPENGITESCPSGEKFLFETYFASGRIKLARALLVGDMAASNHLIPALFNCVTCGACETQCRAPHKAHIVEMIEAAREMVVRQLGHGGENQQKLLQGIGDATKLNPYLETYDDRQQLKRLHQLPDTARFVYFTGCTANYREKAIRDASIRLFKKLDLNFTLVDEWCCGSPLFRTGQTKDLSTVLEHNISRIKDAGAVAVITSCAGCYRTLKKDYPACVGDLPFQVLHTSELLARLLSERCLKILPRKGEGKKIFTYHDPCHLGRHMGVYDAPRALLTALAGSNFVEMQRVRENAWCCGAGGGVRVMNPEWSGEVARKRLEMIRATGASQVVSACPFCKRNLSDAVDQDNSKIEVVDLVELLDDTDIRVDAQKMNATLNKI